MNTYTVTRSLRHNGVVYAVGEQVELSESQAKRLISFGAVDKAISVPPSPPTDNNDDNDDNDDIAIIREIVALFKQNQFGNGTQIAKKPNVDSVRDALDNQDITVEQRDAAWERYKAEGGE